MNLTVTNQSHWQDMMRRQAKTNAEHWIALLENSEDRFPLTIREYDNILRALEYTLSSPDLFTLSNQIINLLFPAVYNFADWDRWAIYLNDALEQSQLLSDQLAEASISEKLGDLHRARSEHTKTEYYFVRSKKLYKDLGHFSQYGSILSKLGALNVSLGKPSLGLNMSLEAYEISQTFNDSHGMAMAELNLSYIYNILKEHQLSLQSATHAYHLFKEMEQSNYAARALNNMFVAWFYLEMWEEIEGKAEALVDELTDIGNVHVLGKLKLNLGTFASKNNDFIVAEKYFQEALNLAIQNQISGDIGHSYNNLGRTYTKMGEWESAEDMLMKSVSLFEDLHDFYNWANAMDNLALLFEAQENFSEAVKILNKVLQTPFDGEMQPPLENLLNEMKERLSKYSQSI